MFKPLSVEANEKYFCSRFEYTNDHVIASKIGKNTRHDNEGE